MRNDALHRRYSGDDRHLAPYFLCNAQGFLKGACMQVDTFPAGARYAMAIATELSLKAFLLHRGISDDWNRTHVRHDLVAATRCARRAGLRTSARFEEIAGILSPYYRRHAIGDMADELVNSICWREACLTVEENLLIVEHQIGPELLRKVRRQRRLARDNYADVDR